MSAVKSIVSSCAMFCVSFAHFNLKSVTHINLGLSDYSTDIYLNFCKATKSLLFHFDE